MSQYIIHHEGAYNQWSTVVDGVCYESALTLDQLRQVISVDEGRLLRAHLKGSSSYLETLDDLIAINREALSKEQFIAKYLTLEKK